MNQKRNEGITLIALVITIIVLLILAGVTINMVLGDDGIIAQAQGAKDVYENESANEDRQIKSASFEMDMMTLEKKDPTAKSEIKTGYGMLTGIKLGTWVSELKKSLPEGYDILKEDGSAIDDGKTDDNEEETTKVATGMQVAKNGKMVLRIVVYGDICGDGVRDIYDTTAFIDIWNAKTTIEYYQMEAADVTHDKIIDGKDCSIIEYLSEVNYEDEIDINVIPNNPNEISIKTQKMAMHEYIEKANKALQTAGNTTFSFEPEINATTGEIRRYNIRGVTSETTLKALLSVLPDNTVLFREGDNDFEFITKNSDETTLSGKVLVGDNLTVSDFYDGPNADFTIARVKSLESN